MNRKFYLIHLVLLLCFSTSLWCQNITIIDGSTGFPIPNVLLYNESMTGSVLTDEHGLAPLTVFEVDEVVYAQHPSYLTLKLNVNTSLSDSLIKMELNQIELGEVVVLASRQIERSKEVSRKIVGISDADIAFYSPQTSADLLGQSEEVFVQKSQMGGGSPMIRGFSANRVLLVYDQVRMNNAISRGGNLHNIISADPLFMERVEVIYGPGTSNYGSDALGGVINMQSKEIFIGEEKTKLMGSALFNYSSANRAKTAHVDFGMGKQKWAWYTSISVNDFKDLRMGSALLSDDYKRLFYVDVNGSQDKIVENSDNLLQTPSAYQQLSLSQKFKFALSKRSELELFGMYSTTSDIPRYERLLETNEDGLPKNAEWYYGPQQWLLTGVKFNHHGKHKLFDSFKSTLSYQSWKESRNSRKFQELIRSERNEMVDVVGLGIDMVKKLNATSSLQYGISSYYNFVNSDAVGLNIETGQKNKIASRYPDGGSSLWLNGIFLSYKKRFGERFNFNGGLRYTYQYLNAQFDDAEYNRIDIPEIVLNTQALTGSLGFTYGLSNKVLVRSNFTSGFRAPNIDDVAKIFDSEPGILIVPNPDLAPEYAYNAEIGFDISDSSFYRLEISAFYTYLDNAIVRDDFKVNGADSIMYEGEKKKVEALVNGEFARIYGVNFGLIIGFNNNFKIKYNHTLTRGMDNQERPVRHVSPDFGAIHFIYHQKKVMADFFIRYNVQFKNNRLAPSELNKSHIYASNEQGELYVPSFNTVNFLIQYTLNRTMQFMTGIENILDIGYRPYSSGISAPGRNFKIGVKSRF